MKRIKAINGYTIYQATARDAKNSNMTEGTFYIYFSSDIRDYGLSNSDLDWEADTIETAIEWCTSSNYAMAKEIVESRTTAAAYDEIAEVEKQLDGGASVDEIEAALDDAESVDVIEDNGLYYVHIEDSDGFWFDHGPYFNRHGAEIAAANYIQNTQQEEKQC